MEMLFNPLFLFWLFQSSRLLHVTHPMPVDCPTCSVIAQGIRFERDGFICQIRVLPREALGERLRQAKVANAYLDQTHIKTFIAGTVAFEVHLENTGERNLNFNPDQIRLLKKGKPFCSQVNSMNILSASTSIPSRDQELMAQFFYKGSVEIQLGENHTQLVVFQSPKKGFPQQRLTLQIGRLFYGLEPATLECSFQFSYE